jgi:AcrR family transcriptional regulator
MPRSTRQSSAVAHQVDRAAAGGSHNGPKRSQRERLLEATMALCAELGHQSVSVAQISSRAGVSSATFYEQFTGKEDCLVAAYRSAAEQVLEQMSPVLDPSDWKAEARQALERLLRAVQGNPNAARMLFIESLGGRERMREERRRTLAVFEERTQDFLDSTPGDAETLDIPAIALVGAVRSIVSRQLRTHTEDQLPMLADELLTWVESYATAPGQERWSTSELALLPPSDSLPVPAPPKLQRLPRGRHGLPASVVARSRRTRIIQATAEVMMAKGYAAATVADIVATAGVAREVFYEHFRDKQHAFLEAQQHPTQYILDTCAAAYFAADRWPERVWSGLRALLELIAANPAISHLRLVECYAAGPDAIRRAEEITRVFTIYLEEGYRCTPKAEALPRLCSQAIGGSIFEIVQRHVARGDFAGLLRRLPQLTYISIAPFVGPQTAVAEIARLAAAPPAVAR